MTHADINDLETRDYIFKIGDRGKAIQARYDENTDALIFPRVPFDYVCKLLNEALSQEPKSGKWICDKEQLGYWISTCSNCEHIFHGNEVLKYKPKYCANCGAKMRNE